MKARQYLVLPVLVATALFSFKSTELKPNELSSQEKKEGWALLFDGKTTNGWHAAKWKKAVSDSHFKTFPEFGKHTKGHVTLQDWAKGISFRNVKIKQL